MTTGRTITRSNGWGYVISTKDAITGKSKQVWRSGFPNETKARDAMYRHIAEIDAGGVSLDVRVSQYLTEWLTRSEAKLAPRTRETYEYTCRKYIVPVLGNIKLADLKPIQIERMYERWNKTLEPSTVHRIHRTIRAALNRAVKWGYINQSPMIRVDSPSNRIEKRKTFTPSEAIAALEWLDKHSPISRLAVYLSLYTGLRRAEIAGLMWSDVDFRNGTVHVRRNRQKPRANMEIVGDTKTEGSNRIVPVADSVMQILKSYRTEQQKHTIMRGEPWTEDVYVLRHLDGEIPDPNTFTKALRKAVKALALTDVSFHDLRHTHATWMLESGVELKVVSERLGHESLATTADIYSHVTQKMQRDAVNKLDDMLRRDQNL